ncbi:MAG: hypothetical protein HKN18_10485 [Silicimonas sp.]|nr:hypothetical protein [Silicimonas sp.]
MFNVSNAPPVRPGYTRRVIQCGGLPNRTGGALVRGIGVGGAPGGHLDEACARAGLDAIRAE